MLYEGARLPNGLYFLDHAMLVKMSLLKCYTHLSVSSETCVLQLEERRGFKK